MGVILYTATREFYHRKNKIFSAILKIKFKTVGRPPPILPLPLKIPSVVFKAVI